MSAVTSKTVPIAKQAPKSKPSRFRQFLRVIFLLVVLGVGSLLIPPVFRAALRQVISVEAWRHGMTVAIGHVQGSLYAPIVLQHSQWTYRSRAGSVTRVEVVRAEAEFAWREMLPGHGSHWFRRLSLDGVTGKVDIALPTEPGAPIPTTAGEEPRPTWYPAPTRIEANNVDLLFQTGDDYVRLTESRLLLTELETGFIDIGQLLVKQPWLTRTFHNVHGTTALQDDDVVVANLQLDPAVTVRKFSAAAREIGRGRLDMSALITAFGGEISAQSKTIPYERGTELEASAIFSQISVAPLATFLGISEAAGGLIKEGNVKFRGTPRDLMRSSLTLRLEANNFQWESRQWDSLTLGATLLARRLQIPELELRQGHNRLSLNGEIEWPRNPRLWWQSDFNFNIAGKIEDLTELSALLLPDFRYAAGKMSIDGTVRSKDRQYFGALIVSGAKLAWRSAPIEELHAAIRLAGKELQIANLDLINKDDYVRGQGVISLDGANTYRGELKASVEDLATYSALLQKPLVPEPLAGGGVITWMGEGSPKGQSGRFSAKLQKLRPLTPAITQLHPVNAEFRGSYDPASWSFTTFSVADEACAFQAQVEIAAKWLQLRGVKLTHGAETWLEGEALLPLDLWNAWPEGKLLGMLADDIPGKVQLKANGLSLAEASRLSGWLWPVAGIVDGELTVEGPIGKLVGGGKVTLKDGIWPVTGATDLLTGLGGELTLSGQTLSGSGLTARHITGNYTGEGTVNLTPFRDPTLQMAFRNHHALVPVFPGLRWQVKTPAGEVTLGSLRAELDLDLQLEGPWSTATLKGHAPLMRLETGGLPELAPLFKSTTNGELPVVIAFPPACAAWKLDVQGGAIVADPAEPDATKTAERPTPTGAVESSLRLGGTGAAPTLTGSVSIAQLPAIAGSVALTVVDSTVTFREGFPGDPTVDLRATGLLEGFPFSAYVVGPATRHLTFFDSETGRAAILAEAPQAAPNAVHESFPPWANFSGERPAVPAPPVPPAPASAPETPPVTPVTPVPAP